MTDHSNVTWHNQCGEKRGYNVTQDDIAFLNEKYQPKKILVEPQIKLESDPEYTMLMTENPTPLSLITNVFYTKWKVNELRKDYQKDNNIKYDFVIQARLDLWFKTPFDIEKYIIYRAVINTKGIINIDISSKLFYASDRWIQNYDRDDILYAGGSDVMYFGTPDVLDKATSLYNNIHKYDLAKTYYSNEYLMLFNAIQHGLEPVKIRYEKDIDFGILRTDQTLQTLAFKNAQTHTSLKPKVKGLKKLHRELRRVITQMQAMIKF